MKYIKHLQEVSADDVSIAGGKAASLGDLIQGNISVPSGFVILTSAFIAWMQSSGYQIQIEKAVKALRSQTMADIEMVSEHIRQWLFETPLSDELADEIYQAFQGLQQPFVAVRSSAQAEDGASAAWAGQLETYLCTTKETLLQHVKNCWISVFSLRALTYAREQELDQIVPVAVIVQSMIDSESAGVAFSVDPIGKDKNKLIIEASYGLGEAIVSGQVTPDSYLVQKEPQAILEQQVSLKTRGLYRKQTGGVEWKEVEKDRLNAPVLSEEQVLELAASVLRIEKQFGFPCDIEWALADGRFFILQSRPITTLDS
jgi:pyruvate,water dikinase